VVAIELLRRKSYWFKEWEIYYWKNAQQNEVDFVIKEGPNVRQPNPSHICFRNG
jgi:predicted AAA+ superfamily ATPase